MKKKKKTKRKENHVLRYSSLYPSHFFFFFFSSFFLLCSSSFLFDASPFPLFLFLFVFIIVTYLGISSINSHSSSYFTKLPRMLCPEHVPDVSKKNCSPTSCEHTCRGILGISDVNTCRTRTR